MAPTFFIRLTFSPAPTQAPHSKQVSSPFLFANLKAVADAVLNPALSVCSHHLLWSLLLRLSPSLSRLTTSSYPNPLCPPYLHPWDLPQTPSCFSSIFPSLSFLLSHRSSIQWHPCSVRYHAPFPSSQGATLKKTLYPPHASP